MKFEVVEIYPFPEETINFIKEKKKNDLTEIGTIHVYIVDFKIDIRNIEYFIYEKKKQNKLIKIKMPYRYYKFEGKAIQVPTINFTNKQIQKDLIDFLKKEIENS